MTESSALERIEGSNRGLPIVAVPVRHPGRWIAVAVLLLLATMATHSLITNPKWLWHTFSEYIFAGVIFEAYFLYIQVFVIGAVCIWCTSYGLSLIARFVIALVVWVRGSPTVISEDDPSA